MKQSERYFRQVKRHIPIGGLRKKEFLCNLQESLAAYAAKKTPCKTAPKKMISERS